MFFKSGNKNGFEGGGLVLFDSVEEAMSGERALKAEGVENRLVAPPPELRRGCDLALEINLVEKPAVERMLRSRQVAFIDIGRAGRARLTLRPPRPIRGREDSGVLDLRRRQEPAVSRGPFSRSR